MLQYAELGCQKISIHRVQAAIKWATEHLGSNKFDRWRFADMSTYVSEYQRYALAREA